MQTTTPNDPLTAYEQRCKDALAQHFGYWTRER